ncbi:MAG TPA: VOC family protein [Acidimicrobiales bacterium]|nr:VOC family protein [Acidimicrobiales bacterium]
MERPRLRIAGTVLSTRDARALAAFYERLLGWPRLADEAGWVVLRPDPTAHGLSFHEDAEYVPPTWPSQPDTQLMMVHLDIATDDLDGAVRHAVECGATVAPHQPQTGVTVMLDPDGHPFCLFRG